MFWHHLKDIKRFYKIWGNYGYVHEYAYTYFYVISNKKLLHYIVYSFLKVHLKDGYGKLIQQYCQLLLIKLDFHRRNPGFPGNLVLSEEDLSRIGDNDVNNYFQMCVEMFDYIDEILGLQSASRYHYGCSYYSDHAHSIFL